MKTLSRILNSIKNLNLTNYKVINGTMESKKFWLILDFDGILKQGKTMTINELAIEMREGFKRIDTKIDDLKQYVDTRFDKIESRLDEHDAILKEHSAILKEHSAILKEHSDILKEHSDIFKRNNLK